MVSAEAAAAAAAQRPSSTNFEATQYQQKAHELVNLVNRLRDAGAQASLDLPSLVVCGNQSAGKSSLLERLAGVKLPRAAGTCTKCPTEVRLFTAQPGQGTEWCCRIKLRQEYDNENRQLESKPAEKAFKTLKEGDKEYLHFYISAAQRALLNPRKRAKVFVEEANQAAKAARSGGDAAAVQPPKEDVLSNVEPAEEDELKFTRNVVVLEITGADVDLALIDLPGIIQSEHADNGSSNVQLVKDLVQHYISSPRAIIVATISCKDDMENQAIFSMAQEADKEGLRTIGVLTKVDTIETGTHHIWLPVLHGEKFPLKLGYYCVVNPSASDMSNNMTLEEAAAKEDSYFNSHAVFSSKDLASMRERFGVFKLRQQLSKQLVSLTQRELPKMKAAVEKALHKVETQLSKLPAPPSSDPHMELFKRLNDLRDAVQRAEQGEGDVSFHRGVANNYAKLRKAVLAARPTVRLTGTDDDGAVDDAEDSSASLEDASSAAPYGGDTTTELNEESSEFWLSGPAPAEDGATPDGLITLEETRRLADKLRARELPTFQPYRVLEHLVNGLKGRWDKAALECLRQVSAQLQELVEALVEQHFGQFSAARAYVRNLLDELHGCLVATTEERVKQLMAMESKQIWTNNDHYMADSKAHFLARLTKQLYKEETLTSSSCCPNGNTVTSNVQTALQLLQQAGVDLSVEELGVVVAKKRQRVEHADDESLLELIAGTLAYFKVSSKRVIDGVPMHINHYLLDAFASQLKELPVFVQAALLSNGAAASAGAASGPESDAGSCHGTAEAAPGSSAGVKQRHVGDALSSGRVLQAAAVRGLRQGSAAAAAAAPMNAAQLMAEDEGTAQQRRALEQKLQCLYEARRMLSVF